MRSLLRTSLFFLGLASPATASPQLTPTITPSSAVQAIDLIPPRFIVPEVKAQGVSLRRQTLCLALALYHEGRNLSEHERVALALVIHNRALLANTSVCTVIWYDNGSQFQWVHHGDLAPNEIAIWHNIQYLALNFLRSPPRDFTLGATHFYNPSIVVPNWSDKNRITLQLQHVFLKLPSFAGETTTRSGYQPTMVYKSHK